MSLPLESGRLPSPIQGAAEEERGGSKVASLILKDIYSMTILQRVYLIAKKYPENSERLWRVVGLNVMMRVEGTVTVDPHVKSRLDVKRDEAEIRPCPNRLFINTTTRPSNAMS